MDKERRYKLKEDVIIPKGTVLECIEGCTTRYSDSMYEAIIGLTKDTAGHFIYCVDTGDKEIMNYFEET